MNRADVSRRDFLKGSGFLVVHFSMGGTAIAQGRPPGQSVAPGFNGPGSNQLDSWIAIGRDSRVTACTGKCELGQGLFTAQTQLIAEELSVPFDHVKLLQCETGITPDQGTTSGAQSHPTNFNTGNLARACATAREALLERASARLKVPAGELAARDGVVHVRSDPARKVTYGELVENGKFNIALNARAKRKPPAEWTVLGKSQPRVELPAMVTGQFEYVHNVRVPGMLHGCVVRPPAIGSNLVGVDESSVRGMPGLVQIVSKKNFLGVVAEKPWQAMQIANRLNVKWSPGNPLPRQSEIYNWLRHHRTTRDTLSVNSKDVDQKLASAARVLKSTYHYPYQMHASIGSSCAVADVRDGKATVWSASQAVYPLQNTMAMVLGLRPEDVRIVFRMASGCYGVNGADPVSYDAALMSQAVGRPVRVQLSRKDEMAWENYGVPFVIDQKAGLDANGAIVAWDYESWSPVFGGRPGTNAPGNVVTGFLAGFEPAPFAARSTAPEPSSYANGNNAVPSYVTGCVGSQCEGTGTVTSQRVLTHNVPSPFFTGPLRSPARLQNTFAHESFMDEIAAAVRRDPVEYRLQHLSDARLIDVVKAAAKAANWETRPSPRSPRVSAGIARGRGMACVLYEGDNGYCAMVAEVSVDLKTGAIAVDRLVIANDCGPISNPDGLRNQLEGGALHGVSRALLEEVTWDDEKVTSVNWRSYTPLFVGAAIPKIETVLINRTDVGAMGAGETAVTVVAAAIGNAVFDATGIRLREAPFTPARVLAATAR